MEKDTFGFPFESNICQLKRVFSILCLNCNTLPECGAREISPVPLREKEREVSLRELSGLAGSLSLPLASSVFLLLQISEGDLLKKI